MLLKTCLGFYIRSVIVLSVSLSLSLSASFFLTFSHSLSLSLSFPLIFLSLAACLYSYSFLFNRATSDFAQGKVTPVKLDQALKHGERAGRAGHGRLLFVSPQSSAKPLQQAFLTSQSHSVQKRADLLTHRMLY